MANNQKLLTSITSGVKTKQAVIEKAIIIILFICIFIAFTFASKETEKAKQHLIKTGKINS